MGARPRDPTTARPWTLAIGVAETGRFYEVFLSTLAGSPVSVDVGVTQAKRAYFAGLNRAMAESVAAIDAGFDSGALFGDTYDPEAVEAALANFFAAQEGSVPLIEALQPPDNLAELHYSYISALRKVAEIRAELSELVGLR